MNRMTSNDLVAAIVALSNGVPGTIVPGSAVEVWCIQNGIDTGVNLSRKNRFFEEADHCEAAGLARLAKYKRGTGQHDEVGWSLVENAPDPVGAAAVGWRRQLRLAAAPLGLAHRP